LKYSLCPKILIAFLIVTALAVSIRLFFALDNWFQGNSTEIEAYSFAVIFPAVLIVALSFMDKTKTKEGLLMRFGTMIQLLLIISLPKFSLYLALGLPVVFLVVELFVTRVPKIITTPIERIIVR
tara:strand:- start:249 stop:623 length:375 start_codon:yes stop_codon:yes gene_type:complete